MSSCKKHGLKSELTNVLAKLKERQTKHKMEMKAQYFESNHDVVAPKEDPEE